MDTVSVDPRIERTRKVVLKAAVEIVGNQGFSGASIDAIAQRSGVARSTIYRHWHQRMDLLLEAVGAEIGHLDALAIGDVRSDLTAIATHLAELLASEPMGSVTASMILESRRDPTLNELRERFVEQRKHAASRVIDGAIKRGELSPGTDAETMVDDIAAPIFFQSLVLHASVDREWIEDHIDRWLHRYGAQQVTEGDDDAN